MLKTKKIIVSVTTDLSTDQRVDRVCASLFKDGYEVFLIGRKLNSSTDLANRKYTTKRFRLLFNKGPLFYANYNLRLFIHLIFHPADCYLSNDLDTLWANYWASKIKNIPLVYDSHEYFTEVPELKDRPIVKSIWERIEKAMLPKITHAYTVSSKIASVYREKYKTPFKVIRNFPIQREFQLTYERKKIVIYQGALNTGRGLEELIESMNFIEGVELWIAGSGDLEHELRSLAEKNNLKGKLKFLGSVLPERLFTLTQEASLGVSIEKKIGLNYTYALPNKIFDYIQAGTPVLYSDLEEVVSTLEGFEVGEVLKSHEPRELALQIENMLSSKEYDGWVLNCQKAAKIFNWQQEEQQLLSIFEEAISN